MSDKRRLEIPLMPYMVLIAGLVMIFSSALIYATFQDMSRVAAGVAAGGVMIGAVAFLMRPAMLDELVRNRKTILWINDIVLILLIIAIGVVLAHIGFRRNVRYDFTRNQMFTLSDQTRKIAGQLEKEVKVTAFYPTGSTEEQMVKELLQEYRRMNAKLQFSFVDPYRDPMTVKAMNVAAPGTIIVQCEMSRKDLMATDVFERPPPYAGLDAKPRFKGEQAITTALINVTSGIKKRISFVTGHGEATTSGFNGRDVAGLNELLIRENYDVDEVNLLESDIAFETNLIAIISPQRDFLDTELEKIRTFIKGRSGHLLVALDPLSETRNLEKFLLQDYGVLANHDVVIDPRGIQRQYWTVAPVLTSHPALSPIIDSNLVCIMFHCRSLTAEGREGFTPVTYLETIENSWAKRNLKAGDEISLEYEEGKDARGPLKLAIALEGSRTATASRILVFGDADFAGNAYISFGGNKDLIINSINWMLGEDKMISIRPKTVEIPEIVLDDAAANQIFTFCVIVSPLMIVFLGGLVFLLRRRM